MFVKQRTQGFIIYSLSTTFVIVAVHGTLGLRGELLVVVKAKVEVTLNKPFLCQPFSIWMCCLVTPSVQILYGNYTAMSTVLRAVGVSNPGQGV